MVEYLPLDSLDWYYILSSCILLGWSVVLFMHINSIIYGLLFLHKTKKVDKERVDRLPGVSIVKPLINMADPNLMENIATFFELNYPKYELLLCIEDETQHELVRRINDLMMKYPHVDAQIFTGVGSIAINPKVNNMLKGYDAAKYPIFMMSDAGINMAPDALTDMVLHLKDNVGLVHQLPYMLDGDLPFSRIMEKVWFGGPQSRVCITANALGFNCMTGMSYLFRKQILDDQGGLVTLGQYLGEDYFLAKAIRRDGWRIVLSSQPSRQNPGPTSLNLFKARMMRWMYVRMSDFPQLYILEPLSENVFLCPLISLACQYLFNIPYYITLPTHMICWCFLDYVLAWIVEVGDQAMLNYFEVENNKSCLLMALKTIHIKLFDSLLVKKVT